MYLDLVKIFVPTTFAFFLGIFITPLATHFFYKYKMWKKKFNFEDITSADFKLIHQQKEETEISTPCVGGIVIWVSALFTVFVFFLLSVIFPNDLFSKLNFFSRSQTFIPVGIFILGAILGLVDDVLEIRGKVDITRNSAWYTRIKLFIITILGLLAGFWFFFKLDMHSVHIPFNGNVELGILFILFVVIVMLYTFSGGVINGLDGPSGGILAFLWFNIPPARFYMGETGMMPLTIPLATIAFLTDTVLILPIIAFQLVITSASSSLQLLAKKFFGKKVFRVAPLHHHFEAIGLPSYKVTMRFWVLAVVSAIIGIILAVISR